MTLIEQIKVVEAAVSGREYSAADMAEAVKSLKFLEKWEKEIRAAIPLWKAARESPAAAQIMEQFPDAKYTG